MSVRYELVDRCTIALLPVESLGDVVIRGATLREALAYARGFNDFVSQSHIGAVMLPKDFLAPSIIVSSGAIPDPTDGTSGDATRRSSRTSDCGHPAAD